MLIFCFSVTIAIVCVLSHDSVVVVNLFIVICEQTCMKHDKYDDSAFHTTNEYFSHILFSRDRSNDHFCEHTIKIRIVNIVLT